MTAQVQGDMLLEQIRRRQEEERARKQIFQTLKQGPASDVLRKWSAEDAKAMDERAREYELREAAREAEEARRRLTGAWEGSGVGRRFLPSRLENYQTPTEGHAVALAKCREIVEELPAGGGALLLGEPEGGKTHLLCGMLFEAAKRGMSIRYVTAEDFYLGLRSRMDEGLSESGFIDGLVRPDVLALDDLYCLAAAKSAHEESYQYRMLWTLLDRRYRDAKSTITSTNKPLAEFKEMLDERTRRRLEAKVVRVPKRISK